MFCNNVYNKLQWIFEVLEGKKTIWPIYQRLIDACRGLTCLTEAVDREYFTRDFLRAVDRNLMRFTYTFESDGGNVV
jgi:hypothetical protein